MPVDKSFKGNSRAGSDLSKHGTYGLFSYTGRVADTVSTYPDKFTVAENQRNHTPACQRHFFVDEDILHLFAPRHSEGGDPIAGAESSHHPGKRRTIQVKARLPRRESP